MYRIHVPTYFTPGFFLATIIAHHLTPKPAALLSITGIPTFHHAFFNSFVLLTPDPIPDYEVEQYLVEPVSIGRKPPSFDAVLFPERLLSDGTKNPAFSKTEFPPPGNDKNNNRGLLYGYYVYKGEFIALLEGVDLGFSWTGDKSKLQEWPTTIFIQGDADEGVREDVCSDTARQLGERAVYLMAPGQNHLFESTYYLEDEVRDQEGRDVMDAVRRAIGALDRVVASYVP